MAPHRYSLSLSHKGTAQLVEHPFGNLKYDFNSHLSPLLLRSVEKICFSCKQHHEDNFVNLFIRGFVPLIHCTEAPLKGATLWLKF